VAILCGPRRGARTPSPCSRGGLRAPFFGRRRCWHGGLGRERARSHTASATVLEHFSPGGLYERQARRIEPGARYSQSPVCGGMGCGSEHTPLRHDWGCSKGSLPPVCSCCGESAVRQTSNVDVMRGEMSVCLSLSKKA